MLLAVNIVGAAPGATKITIKQISQPFGKVNINFVNIGSDQGHAPTLRFYISRFIMDNAVFNSMAPSDC